MLNFDNRYAQLPERFFAQQLPAPSPNPVLIAWNTALAEQFGLSKLSSTQAQTWFSGVEIPEGAHPLAMAYAGHQFGHFSPQLGDGRAVLLGEIQDYTGKLYDVHLKGAGRTPFSRNGDGKAALGPALREYVVSEAMHALGIPTTRALALCLTGESVFREKALPGAILTRVARTHIRVGSFQYFAAQGDSEAVEILMNFVIEQLYPEATEAENPALALLQAVIKRQAYLMAEWMRVGFIHGVMNTDNMQLAGETLDYGPCAFLDAYHPQQVFSQIDRAGRYAFGNQANIALWNLARFAETLLPQLATDSQIAIQLAETALQRFSEQYAAAAAGVFRAKLGLADQQPEDTQLGQELMTLMMQHQADYTLVFEALRQALESDKTAFFTLFSEESSTETRSKESSAEAWLMRWQERRQSTVKEESLALMRQANPVRIPRNHQLERAIRAAEDRQDFRPMQQLMVALAEPYVASDAYAEYAAPPRPEEQIHSTHCGT